MNVSMTGLCPYQGAADALIYQFSEQRTGYPHRGIRCKETSMEPRINVPRDIRTSPPSNSRNDSPVRGDFFDHLKSHGDRGTRIGGNDRRKQLVRYEDVKPRR